MNSRLLVPTTMPFAAAPRLQSISYIVDFCDHGRKDKPLALCAFENRPDVTAHPLGRLDRSASLYIAQSPEDHRAFYASDRHRTESRIKVALETMPYPSGISLRPQGELVLEPFLGRLGKGSLCCIDFGLFQSLCFKTRIFAREQQPPSGFRGITGFRKAEIRKAPQGQKLLLGRKNDISFARLFVR